MHMLPTNTIFNSIVYLLTEAYAGPPDPSTTWFIDNEPDSGVLGIIASVTAAEASKSVDGSGESGTTIASNVEHLRWSLAMMNAAIRGETFDGKWKESWVLLTVNESGWDTLRDELRAEFEMVCHGLQAQTDLPEQYLTGTLALLPHAAYHLGTIRQMIERVRG